MQRNRVVSTVEGPWGKGTVYSNEPEPDVVEIKVQEAPSQLVLQTSSMSMENIVEPERKEDVDHLAHVDPSFGQTYQLTFFQSSLFATILEDTIIELRILVECNNEMRIHKTFADMPLLLALKFRVVQPEVKDELDAVDPRRLACVEYKMDKLDADRKYLGNLMLDLYKDLSLKRSYKSLHEAVQKIVYRDSYRINISLEEAKNRTLRRETMRQQRQQRNHIMTVTYDTDVFMDNLKTEVEDAALNAEIRSRYVGNWQRARTEQHIQTIQDKESKPLNSIEYYKQRGDFEQRVHSEVELLVNIAINETLEKIEKWMEKYDKDMEAIDLKIQIKKNDYQNQLDKRIDLEETIENHDELMKDWVHFKEEREKARLYREKMTKSAITVQAWWRGLLVRRQLGPYKVAKKKGGGKDKKK